MQQDKPDLALPAAIENSTPLGLVQVDGADMTPHAQSRSFMDRLSGVAADIVVNAYGGTATGASSGLVLGLVGSLVGANGAYLFSGPILGGAAGLALGIGVGVAKGITGIFRDNKNELSVKQRIHAIQENIVDIISTEKIEKNTAPVPTKPKA